MAQRIGPTADGAIVGGRQPVLATQRGREASDAAPNRMRPRAVKLPSRAELVQNPKLLDEALNQIEHNLLEDFRSVESLAVEAEQMATELERPDLVMWARLISADVMGRRGDNAGSARVARTINAWGYEHGHNYLIARSHRLLSTFFRRIGDAGEALTQALRCVDHTTDAMPARVRAQHHMALAIVLELNDSWDDGHERYMMALRLVEQDDPRMTLSVLNNMAYTAYELSDEATAVEIVERMRDLEHVCGPLDGLYLDTIARVEMLTGNFAAAEETLRPLVDDPNGPLDTEGDVLPMCLVTLAEARRLGGEFEAAQSAIVQAQQLCAERGLPAVAVETRFQQAELYAAQGRYREAYEEHKGYHADAEAQRSAEREARARMVQAMMEAEEARRDRELYRQMALHDALTGLHNRRYVDEFMHTTLTQAAIRGTPTSVLLVDLDFFKRINDTLSHEVGDDVLRQVSVLLAGSVPPPGIAARLGGEEFLLVLPETTTAHAARVGEIARQAVGNYDWGPLTGQLPVTLSVGVATAYGATTQSALLGQADRNLYLAKRNGRDQVVA
jgi:two-component system, cell cycle response regulator